MKKNLSLLLCLLVHGTLLSQNCAPKGISTDPANPINPDPAGRLNTFDYTATGWPLRTEYVLEDTWKQSPFYSDNNVAIQHFYAPNDGVLDILPSNGWEIIKQDFGYLDDGQPAPEKAKNPFIVLYNRYTNILRVFVARYGQQNFNGANIKVSFTGDSPMQTSLLDFGSGIKALGETFIRDQHINSVVSFPTGPFEWFYSDLQMQYDPCTCLFTSKLQITLSLSNASSVILTGSSSGTIVSNGSPTAEQNDKGPISLGDLFSGAKKAAQGYKSGEKFKNDVQAAINKEAGTQQAAKTSGLNNLATKLATNTFLKAGLNTVPYLSSALSVLQSFVGGGKTAPQAVTITPMAIKQTYDFTGTISNEYPNYASITFRTPGSATSTYPLSQYPYYNEVMGTFNILNTPTFKRTITTTNGYTAKFTLSNDVQYVLNPASKLNIQEIQAYVLIRDQDDQTVLRYLSPSSPDVSISFVHGLPTPSVVGFLIIINLARQNTSSTTQNVLLSFRYDADLVSTIVKSGAKLRLATNIDTYCNSSAYKNTPRFPVARTYEEAVKELEENELKEETKKRASQQQQQGNREKYRLFHAFPNPASENLSIEYQVENGGAVKVYLNDATGSTILSLVDNADVEPGSYQDEFDISPLREGIYHITIEIDGGRYTEKLVIR